MYHFGPDGAPPI